MCEPGSYADQVRSALEGYFGWQILRGTEIRAGTFTEKIIEFVSACTAIVVLIDQNWTKRPGARRCWFDNPRDTRRIALATALRKGMRPIVALLPGTSMPTCLPDDLQGLRDSRHTVSMEKASLEDGIARLRSKIIGFALPLHPSPPNSMKCSSATTTQTGRQS
jgi:hypothetical protein